MDTTVLIGCPVCGRRYRYDTARFGTSGVRLRCRSCEAVMRVEIPVPLLGESAAPARGGAAQDAIPSREGIPVAVPVTARREVQAEARVSEEPVAEEKVVPAAVGTEPLEADSVPVPPWEQGRGSEPESSPASETDLAAGPSDTGKTFVSEEAVAEEEVVPAAVAAEPLEADSVPVPPWEQDTASEPELFPPSEPDPQAEPAASPVDDEAAGHGARSSLEREAARCLDEMFELGENVQETATLPVALVADRDETMRELLSAVLRDSGFQVEEATDGIEARRMLAAHRPAVVFLNAFLPQILGVTLCSEIKGHPELAAGTRVIIVGSLYRRDRFVRDPRNFYGADEFLDGSGSPDEIRSRAAELCAELCGEERGDSENEVDERGELIRLARIVAGDIILYNPQTAEQEIAKGKFFDTFAQEIREGESLVANRYPHVAGHQSLYHETLREAVLQHGEAAGIPVRPGS